MAESQTNGRIGALVAISAGIHPNLTGRENIMLTASFMGLSRKQAAARFDEIVSFAELEDAIDRQAKYYSMGMQARLGFGVAAFLEPAILLVDEVLAVGDAAFQQRCLDRMRYVLSQGTTLVFVSHDLAAVEATCARCVWLSDGRIRADGPTRDVLGAYRGSAQTGGEIAFGAGGPIVLHNVAVRAPESATVQSNGALEIELELESEDQHRAWMYVGVSEGTATPMFLVNPGRETLFERGRRLKIRCVIDRLPLPKGRFYVWAGVYDRNSTRSRALSVASGRRVRRLRAQARRGAARRRAACTPAACEQLESGAARLTRRSRPSAWQLAASTD